ncbi:MAG: hypothetical protein NTW19_19505 [Planctomycetota bacterium]|nr:hypothetical protein [Planctomycetota bacterium]
MTSSEPPSEQAWRFDAALATWFMPGVGHMFLGESRRGAILGLTILILWIAGFLIGGVSVFDRTDHPLMFVCQVFFAPSAVADQALQRILKTGPGDPLPSGHPAYEPSFGRVNEQGVLYTALAGMLNLLAILDVIHRDPHRRRSDNPNVGTTLDLAARPAASGSGTDGSSGSGSGSGGGGGGVA